MSFSELKLHLAARLKEAGVPEMWTKASQRKCALCGLCARPPSGARPGGRASLCMLCLTYWHDDCSQAVMSHNMTAGEFSLPQIDDAGVLLRECGQSFSALPAWLLPAFLAPDANRTRSGDS